MAAKFLAVACIAFAVIDVSSAQCIKNLVPSCGCSGVDVIPNQVILNQAGFLQPGLLQPGLLQPGLIQPGLIQSGINLIPGLAGNVVSPAIVNGQYALPAAANIIQDNSVATNLANTLQLLLVSNLLSNTLPNSPDLLTVPACSPYATGLSYIC